MRDRAWPAVQRLVALFALLALSPLLLAIATAVKADSGSPVLFRSTRIQRLEPFTMLKFRTMAPAIGPGEQPRVTVGSDPRITRIGRRLRRMKLDELPQLWNVAKGEMLLVGPRPEDPTFVDDTGAVGRFVFSQRPGITGPTALRFKNEEQLLDDEARNLSASDGRSSVTQDDVERAYRERILPRKLEMDAEYLRTRSVSGDLFILLRTIKVAVRAEPSTESHDHYP